MEDLEDLLGAADWKRVCLSAQKSYKSEQIEQINNDKKKIWRIWKDLENFSAKPTEKSVPHNSHPNPTLTGGPPDNTQLYV